MARQRWNAVVRSVMAVALVATGFPLVAKWLPVGAQRPHSQIPGERAGSDEVAGLLEVDARDDLTPAQLESLNSRYGLKLHYNSVEGAADKLLISDVAPAEEAALLARLSKDPLVEAAGAVHRFSTPLNEERRRVEPGPSAAGATPNDPLYPKQWNLKLVDAEGAWRDSRGKGVIVAVIDTGVAAENDERCYRAEDFAGTRFVPGWDFVADDAHPNDDHGHGTHVSGTIAETTNNAIGCVGLAHEATIMPLKVLDEWGSGTSADIADAIRFAADHGARIINMSLGGGFPDPVMHNACKYAAKKGVLIVCAAGNSMGGPVGYPAAFPECLAVSSVGPTGELAYYSSVGKEVGIAGPGGDTRQDPEGGILQNTVVFDNGPREDGYFAFQGTSMASPHVAAAAALVMARGVTDAAQVRQILERAAKPKLPAEKYGVGVLDAGKAVRLAGEAHRNSFLLLVVTVIAFVGGLGVGGVRKQLGKLTKYPFVPVGLALGLLGPDLLFGWLGFGSGFNLVLHSALVPLYLLWEVEGGAGYRFVAAMAGGMALHLGWDAFQGQAPFPGVLPVHALPWLWTNVIVGLGVALVAYRRGHAAP